MKLFSARFCAPLMQNSSSLYLSLKLAIDNEWERLHREQLTPWCFMTAGPLFQCKDFYGGTISYGGIRFEGTARMVFWGTGYIPPFLKDIVERSINHTFELCTKKNVPLPAPLNESVTLLKTLVRRTYKRMADIDQQLRGNGVPESATRRPIENEVSTMEAFIEQRAAAELQHWKPKSKLSTFIHEHKVWIGLALTVVGLVMKFVIT